MGARCPDCARKMRGTLSVHRRTISHRQALLARREEALNADGWFRWGMDWGLIRGAKIPTRRVKVFLAGGGHGFGTFAPAWALAIVRGDPRDLWGPSRGSWRGQWGKGPLRFDIPDARVTRVVKRVLHLVRDDPSKQATLDVLVRMGASFGELKRTMETWL